MYGTRLVPGLKAKVRVKLVAILLRSATLVAIATMLCTRPRPCRHQSRLRAAVVLVALHGLPHLRVTLGILVTGGTRCTHQRGIDDGALTQRKGPVARVTFDQRQNTNRQLVLSRRRRKLKMVAPSGIRSQLSPDNWYRMVVSYRASSIAKSLWPKQCCIRCIRSIAIKGHTERPPYLFGNAAQLCPAMASPNPPSTTILEGATCSCRRRRRLRSSVSSGNETPGSAYFTKNR